MNINLTLIGQSIAMLVFVWFCMKFIWPPILDALDTRSKKIADGLAAGDEAEKALAEAQQEAGSIVQNAREQASGVREQAEKRATQIMEETKAEATAERQRQVSAAEAEIQLSASQARESLRGQVAGLVVQGAGKVIGKEIDADRHSDLIEQLIKEI
ncbi:MAG: F0F1 ATP synthase subunit B [Gammaproteobacteria bacterium]|nr:F0F1 ATP synthase subunit B [Gammaproteobacteria bacterium]NNC97856.1 F0F1 ATP synthase subunit B [Gammaproteobacteria bacterium]NNM12926.1 F0F1 ATP synthase subunit B [Gammaproteobacteria bacterium]